MPQRDNVHAIEDFPMPEMFTQVWAFCGLVGHYQCFIKGFAHLAKPLYDVLGKEVKMGPVLLKQMIQSAPVLVFPDFEKPFLL